MGEVARDKEGEGERKREAGERKKLSEGEREIEIEQERGREFETICFIIIANDFGRLDLRLFYIKHRGVGCEYAS